MYFDFEDYRPDIPTLDRSLTQLEIVLLTVIVHLLIVISILAWPHLAFVKAMYAAQEQRIEAQRQKEQDDLRNRAQFVFVAPKVEVVTKVPPKLAELSDRNRRAQTMEKAPDPKNDVAFSRGNSGEKIVSDSTKLRPQPSEQPSAPANAKTAADNGAAAPTDPNALRLPNAPQATIARNEPSRNPTLGAPAHGPADAAPARHRRADRDRQERARHRHGGAVRRRDCQLRFDGRLPGLRHRHRQGPALSTA